MQNLNIEYILKDVFSKLKDEELVDKALSYYVDSNDTHSLCHGYPSIIVLLGAFQEISGDLEIDKLAHKYVIKFIEKFKRKKYENYSLYSGLTGMAMSIYLVSRNKLKYMQLINSFNDIIIRELDRYLDFVIKEKDNLREGHYDLINGVTGQIIYLFNFKEDERILRLIKKSLEYLIYISLNDEEKMPRFIINKENMNLESDKEYYKSGFLNQGLSHGIAGPLMVLSLSIAEGIEIESQREAINKILNFLCDWYYEENNNIWWYGRVTKEEFINNKKSKIKNRASWCYGTPGIARSMYTAGKIVNHNKAKNLGYKALVGLCNISEEEYLLRSPTICHGYAGVLIAIDSMYKDTKENIFKEGTKKLIKLILDDYNNNFEFGFINKEEFENNKVEEIKDLGLLEGAIGTILSLLNTIQDKDLKFKRIFLIN